MNPQAAAPRTRPTENNLLTRIAPQLRSLAVPLDSVVLHPRNPRHGATEAVAESLRRFGQRKPIVVQANTRHVVAGNHLVLAARRLGWTEIAANVQDMADAEATAYMLADNRTADLGGYDETLLATILAEQSASDNLLATGYTIDDVAAQLRAAGIDDTRGDPDDAPQQPTPRELYVGAGQLWALGSHRLLVGDAADPTAVKRVTDDQDVDLLWTDPPYGVGYVGKTRAGLTIANDALGADGTRDLLTAALRLAPLRPGGAFYVMAPTGPLHLEFLLALRAADLTLRQTLVWLKDRLNPGRSDYQAMHEAILYGWRGGAPHYFVGGRTQSSIWEIARPGKSALHPTMKPSELVARAIRNSTRPGDRVYDPFLGSGTTLIAAEMTGRVALGVEIDPTFAQVSIERWQRFTGRKAERAEELPVQN